MRTTLIDELVAARMDENYGGPCRVTDKPDSVDIRRVPLEIRAVVALWNRKDRLATMPKRRKSRKKQRGRGDRGVYFVVTQEARALEMIMCDWLRAHFKLGKNARITVCSKWRCSISFV